MLALSTRVAREKRRDVLEMVHTCSQELTMYISPSSVVA